MNEVAEERGPFQVYPRLQGISRWTSSLQKAHAIYRSIRQVVDDLADVETRVSKSQIGFYRKHPFASVWRPDQYLRGEHPPLVLSVFLRRRDRSARWKQVVQHKRGRFTHHVELGSTADVDHEVREWIAEAWREVT